MERNRIISVMKEICIKNEEIQLSLGEIAVASWKEKGKKLNSSQWRDIGRVSALSFAFNIKPEELEGGE